MKDGTSRNIWGSILFYLFIAVFVLVAMFPLLWVFKMSIVTRAELYASPPTILPQTFTTDSYATIFADATFQRALLNSTVIAGTTTVICLFLGSIAAYAIARLRFRFSSLFLTLILAIAFFPPVAIIAPLFLMWSAVNLNDTYWAMIIPNTVFSLPLTIWLLVAFFKELPKDLEEAAKVDGATTIQAFRKVIVPLAAPGVFTTAILTFIFAWNEFLFANTFSFTERTMPVTVAIPNFATVYTVNYGAQAAAAVVVTIPLVILVLFFQRRIVSGLTAGAVKG
ncbi:carbohydrate ABC transporter permease [Rubrobacter taiwanensis]|jgi:multiple sugar transport system permease protein|uniref:Carbohydrate ABC transporter permease n=1 Tax=Rubrobacter taiwanensis TaxID=185139 RepID=A0A4R1BS37_9ACTN|nr:carbohydrate ABC transporter permease [Rubrobacter taiwanensis]TCJ20623.1 carbohydrate ABC transporter permease [Rubrobacter taiwanensis]